MAAETPQGDDAASRGEMDAAPPFLTWRAIYAIVLGALGAEVAAGIALASLLS